MILNTDPIVKTPFHLLYITLYTLNYLTKNIIEKTLHWFRTRIRSSITSFQFHTNSSSPGEKQRNTFETLTTSLLPFYNRTKSYSSSSSSSITFVRIRFHNATSVRSSLDTLGRTSERTVCFCFHRRIPRGDAFDGGAHSRGSTSLNGRGGSTTTSRDKFVWIINNKVPRGIVSATRDTSFPTISNSVVRGWIQRGPPETRVSKDPRPPKLVLVPTAPLLVARRDGFDRRGNSLS